VRFGEKGAGERFRKERWAAAKAASHGIPTAPPLFLDEFHSHPYMVMVQVEGGSASELAETESVVRQLGQLAAKIHGIETSGFGEVFDWAPAEHRRTFEWSAFVRGELRLEERLETLVRHDLLSIERADRVRDAIVNANAFDLPVRLNHGDLHLKNALVDGEGIVVALVDWEFCVSSFAPLWDFSIALHDLSIDDKVVFLAGYGAEAERLEEWAPAMQGLNILHYAPLVQSAADEGDDERMADLRMRLTGTLDLFAL
jgi:hygromycin-B 4-O-kinase